jgi:hypothetical protein
VDKLDRKPSEGVDVWNRNNTQKNSERMAPSHADSDSPSAVSRASESTGKLWADSLPPCEPAESPPKPAVTVPEDKPKSVSSDVKKEAEKKEGSGTYHSVRDLQGSEEKEALLIRLHVFELYFDISSQICFSYSDQRALVFVVYAIYMYQMTDYIYVHRFMEGTIK